MRLPPRSSTTHPLTKAVWGSLSQTYLFPEKSFSPSMPSTTSDLCLISSLLMKEGAKVLDCGVSPLDTFRTWPCLMSLLLGLSVVPRDFPRTCPEAMGVEEAEGEGKSADFGLPLLGGLGDGDDCLMNGLLRTVPILHLPRLLGSRVRATAVDDEVLRVGISREVWVSTKIQKLSHVNINTCKSPNATVRRVQIRAARVCRAQHKAKENPIS